MNTPYMEQGPVLYDHFKIAHVQLYILISLLSHYVCQRVPSLLPLDDNRTRPSLSCVTWYMVS